MSDLSFHNVYYTGCGAQFWAKSKTGDIKKWNARIIKDEGGQLTMENEITQFPHCPDCRNPMVPIWYLEKEIDSCHRKTGRVRKSIDYLYCPYCSKKEPYYHTLSGEWYKE